MGTERARAIDVTGSAFSRDGRALSRNLRFREPARFSLTRGITGTAKRRLKCAVASLLALTISACTAARQELHQPLADEATGENFVALEDPIVFSRSVAALSAGGRDYLYLMPVEANQSGNQTLYLWVGLASNVDRRVARAGEPQPVAIELEAGDDRVRLPLAPWQDARSNSPIAVSLPVNSSLRTAIETPTLVAMAKSQALEVRLIDASERSFAYRYRRGAWQQWQSVAQSTGIGLSVEVQSLE